MRKLRASYFCAKSLISPCILRFVNVALFGRDVNIALDLYKGNANEPVNNVFLNEIALDYFVDNCMVWCK